MAKNKTDLEKKVLLSTREFSDLYNVGVSTLYKLWQEGKGPRRIKVGKSTRIKRVDADTWLSNL